MPEQARVERVGEGVELIDIDAHHDPIGLYVAGELKLDQPRRHQQPADNRGSLGRGRRAALLRFESDLQERGDTDKMEVGAI